MSLWCRPCGWVPIAFHDPSRGWVVEDLEDLHKFSRYKFAYGPQVALISIDLSIVPHNKTQLTYTTSQLTQHLTLNDSPSLSQSLSHSTTHSPTMAPTRTTQKDNVRNIGLRWVLDEKASALAGENKYHLAGINPKMRPSEVARRMHNAAGITKQRKRNEWLAEQERLQTAGVEDIDVVDSAITLESRLSSEDVEEIEHDYNRAKLAFFQQEGRPDVGEEVKALQVEAQGLLALNPAPWRIHCGDALADAWETLQRRDGGRAAFYHALWNGDNGEWVEYWGWMKDRVYARLDDLKRIKRRCIAKQRELAALSRSPRRFGLRKVVKPSKKVLEAQEGGH